MVLARLRQLAAHEVGHTLGLAHNFAASTKNRASASWTIRRPLVKLTGAALPDLSDAYATGIGEWDKVAIEYGYQRFPGRRGREQTARRHPAAAPHDAACCFISDADARPEGSAHPLWRISGTRDATPSTS